MISRFGVTILTLALFAGPAAAEPFHHPYGEWREYHRDWLAACPDVINEDALDYYGFSCFASTGSQELNSANLPAYKLTIMRNRLSGDIDVAVTVAGEDGAVDPSRPMVLAFSGQAPLSLDFTSDLETRYNTSNQYYVADPTAKQALIERMKARNGLVLTVPLAGAVKSKDVRLSLRGVAASLDFMATYARKVTQY